MTKWTLERHNGVKVWRRGFYSVWCDRDADHGLWAASVSHTPATPEQILGHAETRRGAQRLCADHEKKG